MKKKALAIGASAASAVAVLAAPLCSLAAEVNTFTDSLTVTVNSSCGITTQDSDDLSSVTSITGLSGTATAGVGTMHEWSSDTSATGYEGAGTNVKVVCNDLGGWHVFAKGGTNGTIMKASNASSTDIATDNEITSGSTSAWAFKIQQPEGSAVSILTGYDDWAKITSDFTEVVKSTSATDHTTGAFSTAYRIYVGTAQQADTYTGSVTYKLVHPASKSVDD